MSDWHPSEDELVLYHYGEDESRALVEHLAACEACRATLEDLRRVLAAVDTLSVPERDAAFGRAVFEELRPRLARRARVLPFAKRAALPLAAAASLVFAFLLGRASRPEPIPAPARERILLVAVGDHLERSKLMLVELVNAGDQGPVDISTERRFAEQLVPSNRLYRQAALRAGDTGLASVLDDLERVLVQVATSPDQVTPLALDGLKGRIAAQGLLFKVRVLESQVRARGRGLRRGPEAGAPRSGA
jgi:hypothetical protein